MEQSWQPGIQHLYWSGSGLYCSALGSWWQIGSRWGKFWRSSQNNPPVFSGSVAVKLIETVAVHVTIGTERNGDSWRTCANDEHVARTACLNREISRLTAENPQYTGWLTRTVGDCDCSDFRCEHNVRWIQIRTNGMAAPHQGGGGRQDRTPEKEEGKNSRAAPEEENSNTQRRRRRSRITTTKMDGRESSTTDEEKHHSEEG